MIELKVKKQTLLSLPNILWIAGASIFILASLYLLLFQTARPANAASTAGFQAGNIIDDYVMGNKTTMTESQIQTFLKNQEDCTSTGNGYINNLTIVDNGTRGYLNGTINVGGNTVPATWWWDLKDGHFICMADESFNGESAAHIIYQAAQDYSINPQVLIVLLQKEQGLVTDSYPNDHQYDAATGYDCPDNGNGCNNANAGFKNQIRKAANLFREVLDNKDYDGDGFITNYPVGLNTIQYNPTASCGGSTVNIENRATSALYRYTPYQPNAGALAAGYGEAPCGAYGNRNFYLYFTDWFGSTHALNFVSLDTPRWMQVKNDGTQKIDLTTTSQAVGDPLSAGTQRRFLDKILINNKWYLRTESNYNDGGLYGIDQNNLEEIPYQDITPKWVTFTKDGNRSYPSSRVSVGDNLVRGTSVKVVDQITVDGNVYYRTEFNKDNNQSVGIHSQFITDFSPIDLDGPRNFCTNVPLKKIDPTTGETSSEEFTGSFFINKKTLVNGVWYYQEKTDNGTSLFFDSEKLHNTCYVPFEGPRNMRLNQDVARFNPYTNEKYDTLKKGSVIMFSSKILIGNQWYYRTAFNTQNNTDAVIPASAVSDL